MAQSPNEIEPTDSGTVCQVKRRQVASLRARLAQAERERDTALYDAKGCAKASLMIAGDFAKAEARAERLEVSLREIEAHNHAGPCDWVCTKYLSGIAREALASPSPQAEARQDGALDPEMPR